MLRGRMAIGFGFQPQRQNESPSRHCTALLCRGCFLKSSIKRRDALFCIRKKTGGTFGPGVSSILVAALRPKNDEERSGSGDLQSILRVTRLSWGSQARLDRVARADYAAEP